MDKYRQIAELMKGFQSSGQVFFPATVERVDGITCTVKIEGLSVSDVRLKPTTTHTANQVLMIPMVGSNVLVASLSGEVDNLFVVAADTIDRMEVTCNGQNVMRLISDLIGALSGTLQLSTSAGPATGSFDPSTLARLKAVETAFKQIFK